MRTLRPLLVVAAIALGAPLSGCATAYDVFGPPASKMKTTLCPAPKPREKGASAKTYGKIEQRKAEPRSCVAAKKGGGRKTAKDEPQPLGACITYQFMGGADCEALTKKDCYERHMNVVDWRKGVSCPAAALGARAAAKGE